MAVDATARILDVRDQIISEINADCGTFTGIVDGASNATPIEITTSAPHGLTDGQDVTIAGVSGNTAANGTWTVTVTGATTFTLTDSVGNDIYTTGGTWTVTRFVAAASYLPEYRLQALSVLQVDVRAANLETEELDRTPSSTDTYNLEIILQKAATFSEAKGNRDRREVDKLDELVNLSTRIAKI